MTAPGARWAFEGLAEAGTDSRRTTPRGCVLPKNSAGFVPPAGAGLLPNACRSRWTIPAVVMVLCLAGAVNRRATIQPKANDTGWVVVPNLWGGIIAPPGFMKSPVIQACARPLLRIQAEWRWEHESSFGRLCKGKRGMRTEAIGLA